MQCHVNELTTHDYNALFKAAFLLIFPKLKPHFTIGFATQPIPGFIRQSGVDTPADPFSPLSDTHE
jgi:hypothetical protein